MQQRFSQSCDHADTEPVSSGKENGYDYRLWLQVCRYDDTGRPPEITWFKMIQGNDRTYVVQKAFHVEPTKAQVVDTMHYLKGIQVCDSRLKDRPCPTLAD